MSNIRVGIVGAAGYTGGELVRILLHHPHVQIGFVHSTSHAGMPVQTVHRDLVGDTDLHFTDQYDDRSIDFLFMCSGHGKSKQFLSKTQSGQMYESSTSVRTLESSVHPFRGHSSTDFLRPTPKELLRQPILPIRVALLPASSLAYCQWQNQVF
jgi:N-acetyl-gamma-glutamylphosphate reductase